MIKTHTTSEVTIITDVIKNHRKILIIVPITNYNFSFISMNKRGGKTMYPTNNRHSKYECPQYNQHFYTTFHVTNVNKLNMGDKCVCQIIIDPLFFFIRQVGVVSPDHARGSLHSKGIYFPPARFGLNHQHNKGTDNF